MPHCIKGSAKTQPGAHVHGGQLREGCLATGSHRAGPPEKGLRQPHILTGQIRNLKSCCTNCSQQRNIMSDQLKLPACRMDLGLKSNQQ